MESQHRQWAADIRGENEITPGETLWALMNGVGFYMGNQQEAYDAELFAIMRGIRHLTS